jgi:hypothetical protein
MVSASSLGLTVRVSRSQVATSESTRSRRLLGEGSRLAAERPPGDLARLAHTRRRGSELRGACPPCQLRSELLWESGCGQSLHRYPGACCAGKQARGSRSRVRFRATLGVCAVVCGVAVGLRLSSRPWVSRRPAGCPTSRTREVKMQAARVAAPVKVYGPERAAQCSAREEPRPIREAPAKAVRRLADPVASRSALRGGGSAAAAAWIFNTTRCTAAIAPMHATRPWIRSAVAASASARTTIRPVAGCVSTRGPGRTTVVTAVISATPTHRSVPMAAALPSADSGKRRVAPAASTCKRTVPIVVRATFDARRRKPAWRAPASVLLESHGAARLAWICRPTETTAGLAA